MEEDKNRTLSREEITNSLKLVKDYLGTRKGLLYVVHYAGALVKEGLADLRLPRNSIYTTGSIEEAVGRFFVTQSVVKAIQKIDAGDQEIKTVVTGEVAAVDVNLEELYLRAQREPVTLLMAIMETVTRDQLFTVLLQVMQPDSPIKDTESSYDFEPYNGVLN